jgi:hypothetical protein
LPQFGMIRRKRQTDFGVCLEATGGCQEDDVRRFEGIFRWELNVERADNNSEETDDDTSFSYLVRHTQRERLTKMRP